MQLRILFPNHKMLNTFRSLAVAFGPSPAAQSAHRQSSWDRPGILAANAKVEEARSILLSNERFSYTSSDVQKDDSYTGRVEGDGV